jgi:tetratricopeptide (TPR) repeat protein
MMSGHAHLAVAYFLLKVHAIDQAFDELRVAAERDASVRPRAAQWAILVARQPEDALRIVPAGPDGVTMLLTLAGSSRLSNQRLKLLEQITERDPSSVMGQTVAARAYLDALEKSGNIQCHFAQQPLCLERANKHILAIAHLDPTSSLATELTARELVVTGRATEARSLLSSTCGSFAKPAKCWQARISLGSDRVSDPDFTDALRAYYSVGCTTENACIGASIWLAGTLERRGDYAGALEYYNRAVRAGSETSGTWLAIARVAHALQQPRRANEALQRAQRATADPDLRRDIDKARLNSLANDSPKSN